MKPIDISVIILAGGLGTRMREITKFKPKPLVLFKGIPLISRIISNIEPYVSDFLITTKYYKDQFIDLKYSYSNLNLLNSDGDNMVSSFIESCKKIKSKCILGVSSDIVFDQSLVAKSFEIIKKCNKQDVIVFLTKSNSQKYKNWNWVIKNNILQDIKVEKESTGYEKLFILFPKDVIDFYTNSFSENLGVDEKEFENYTEYNKGWIYLLKRMIDKNVKIRVYILEGVIKNINSINDLTDRITKHNNVYKK